MNNALRIGKQSLTVTVAVATILWSVGVALVLPLQAGAATLVAGDLIKRPDLTAVYYYGEDGKRHAFPTQAAYESWYGKDFSKVKTITVAEMSALSLGKNVTYRPGTRLVKITSDPKVYAVEKNGNIRWLETEAVAAALYGSDWAKKVDDLPDSLFAADYSIGTSVKAAADHDKTAATNASPSISVDKGLGTAAPAVPTTPAPAPVAGGKATLTGFKVLRSGLTTDARLTAGRLWDGTTQLGTSQTLNSNHQLVFTGLSVDLGAADASGAVEVKLAADSPAAASVTYNAANAVGLKVMIGAKTLTVSFDVAAAGAGEVIILGIASAADVAVSGATVKGTFPLNGAGMSISAVTIGTVTLDAGPSMPSSDTNVRPDEAGRLLSQWRVTIGSTEGSSLRQVTLIRSGTVSDGAIKNVTLKNDSKGEALGSGKLTNGRLTLSLNLGIGKGENVLLGAYVDMDQTIATSNQTVGLELHDGVSYLLQAVGTTYGFGITPTRASGCTTTGVTGGACQTQTVSAPTVRIEKSAQTPATGNVAPGGNGQLIGAFDFIVNGGGVTMSRLTGTLTPAAGGSASDWTNIVFVDKDGNVLAGPKDGSTATANTAESLVYTDTISFPVGTTTLFVKSNSSVNAQNSETVVFAIADPDAAGNMTFRETLSAKSVTASTGTAVSANTLTVKGPSFSLVTGLSPIAGTIVRNSNKFAFVSATLDATAGGEDAKVASITAADTLSAGTDYSGIVNLELWGDPDGSDGKDETVRLETSNSTATNAATVTFTFVKPIRVSNKSTMPVYLKASVTSDAAAIAHTFILNGAVATGWSTGQDITETFSGAGQAQTIATQGTLKVELASDTPPATQFAAGTSGVAAVKYKVTAAREGVDVTELPIVLGGTATAGDVSAVRLKLDGVLIGSTNGYALNGSAYVLATLASGTAMFQKDIPRYLTIEVTFYPKEQVTSGRSVIVGIADSAGVVGGVGGAAISEWGAAGNYNITATGKESGAAITKSGINSTAAAGGTVAGGNTSFVYDGVVVIVLDSTSPSGVQTAGALKIVLRYSLTANGDEITVYDTEFIFSGAGTAITNITNSNAALQSADGSVTYATWVTGTAWFGGADMHITTAVSATRAASTTPTAIAIAPGATLSLKLVGDTTGKTTNNTFQASIGDGTALVSGLAWMDTQLAGLDGTNCPAGAFDFGAECAVDSALTKHLPVTGNGLSF